MDGNSFRSSTLVNGALGLLIGAAISTTLLSARVAQAADDDSFESPPVSTFQDTTDDVGYDTIVNSLNRQVSASEQATNRARNPKPKQFDPFENVLMHAGAGIAVMSESLDFADGTRGYFNGRGFQASLGIDLFSVNWAAEGTVRSFDANEDHNLQMGLKEFELKLYYKDRIVKSVGYRIGAGISGRYLTVKRTNQDTIEQSTPSSVFTTGLDFFATDKVSFGIDVSGRTAMISDTIDRGSIDGTVRVDANF